MAAIKSSGGGAWKVRLLPVVGPKSGCVCVSWWRRTSHFIRFAGIVDGSSSASVPMPVRVMVWPTEYSIEDEGDVISAVGLVFPASILTESVSDPPLPSLTVSVTRYSRFSW